MDAEDQLRKRALALGAAIKSARDDARVTQSTLAANADIDPQYLAVVERGEDVRVNLETILRIALALDISPTALVDAWANDPAP